MAVSPPDPSKPDLPERRNFLMQALAGMFGSLLVVFPFLSGLGVILDPLWRKSTDGEMIRIGSLDALPQDGTPVKFPVLSDKQDAWNKFSNVPIGAVYVRLLPNQQCEAFNVICPHAGCYVDFLPDRRSYLCPCHRSTFSIDGKINDPKSPSPRGLDPLLVEVRNDKELWVKFQNFQTGRSDRVPMA